MSGNGSFSALGSGGLVVVGMGMGVSVRAMGYRYGDVKVRV
jgi:hypothetical protein